MSQKLDQLRSELIPYELTIDDTGKIQNIVVKDDEYLVSQSAALALTTEEEEIEVDPTVPGSEEDSGALINPLPLNVAEMAASKLSSSNKTKVANYAIKWAKSYNPAYKRHGYDCTNFASQALYAGGWKKIEGYYKSNSKWFGYGVMTSWTWSGAENFYRFARNESKRASRLASVYSLVPGDILQYKTNGAKIKNMTHTMVTTKKINGVPYLSHHSNATLNKPFTQLKQLNVTWYAHRI
ncbi:amidase domain-containing protein [Glutamicibacter sp. NPDC087661]|uniref:amidase domain-containing protein n=1 Tax=Glutamicibacter sp. NPDC087661 TaxID=3363996 RepID=UPI0037F45568